MCACARQDAYTGEKRLPVLVQESGPLHVSRGAPLEVGMRHFQRRSNPSRSPGVVRIAALGEKRVKVDANNELAARDIGISRVTIA